MDDEKFLRNVDKTLERTVDRRLEADDHKTRAFVEMCGPPGESVPEVDTDDLKAVWRMGEEVQKAHPGEQFAICRDVLSQVCKPGANMNAVCYRTGHLGILKVLAGMPRSTEPEMATFQDKLSAVVKDGELIDTALNAASKVPMTWEMQGLPFDFDEFLRLCA